MRRYILTTLILTSLIFATQVYAAAVANPFGTVNNPMTQGALGPQGGLIMLFNNILRLVFVFAGIFAFLKILVAGVGFINAGGDTKKIEQAWNSIWQSLLGLTIVVSSIALAALMGLILFGNAGAILNPQIYGPGNTNTTNNTNNPPGSNLCPRGIPNCNN